MKKLKLKSTCIIQVADTQEKVLIIDLLDDNGKQRCDGYLSFGSQFWDNSDYVYVALNGLINKSSRGGEYKDLKNSMKAEGFNWKEIKGELKEMFEDAIMLKMFKNVGLCK